MKRCEPCNGRFGPSKLFVFNPEHSVLGKCEICGSIRLCVGMDNATAKIYVGIGKRYGEEGLTRPVRTSGQRRASLIRPPDALSEAWR